MSYSSHGLPQLYDAALDHYATKGAPFDFYRSTTRKDNPYSQMMAEHITNLLRKFLDRKGKNFIESFPQLVALALLNDALRDGALSECF